MEKNVCILCILLHMIHHGYFSSKPDLNIHIHLAEQKIVGDAQEVVTTGPVTSFPEHDTQPTTTTKLVLDKIAISKFTGYCRTTHAVDQDDGVINLGKIKGDKWDCLRACRKNPEATGCEFQGGGGKICAVHTKDVAMGGRENVWTCFVFEYYASSEENKKSCVVDFDIDYPGLDLNLATGPTSDRRNSANQCRTLCNSNPDCNYFGWKENNGECWMKTGISRKDAQTGTTSGSACRAVGSHASKASTRFNGYCLDSFGNDQNTGGLPQGRLNLVNCLKKCKSTFGATGCEYYDPGRECMVHTRDVVIGGGSPKAMRKWSCYVFGKAGRIG